MKNRGILNISKENILIVETILYGIVIILAVYLSIDGMLIFKMIPILFITGLISRFIFDKPILLSAFGFSISLLIIELCTKNTLQYNFFYSLYTFICLYSGALSGRYILSIYHSKAKNFTVKKAHNMSLAILTIFIGIFFNIYVNGDFISYFKSKQQLEKYIESNYNFSREKYSLSNPSFVSGDLNYYSFNFLINDAGIYKMGVYLDGKVIDGYRDSKLKSSNLALESKFRFKYLNELGTFFDVSVKYIDINENIVLRLDKNVESVDQDIIDEAINEISSLINKISDFDEFDKIMKLTVCIKTKDETYIADIYKDDFGNAEKYKEKFLIEVFDI